MNTQKSSTQISPKDSILKRWRESPSIGTPENQEQKKLFERFKSDGAPRYDIMIDIAPKIYLHECNLKKISGRVTVTISHDGYSDSSFVDFDVKIFENKISISFKSETKLVEEHYLIDKKYGVIENTPLGNFVYAFEIEGASTIKISKYYFKKKTKKRGRRKKKIDSDEAEHTARDLAKSNRTF